MIDVPESAESEMTDPHSTVPVMHGDGEGGHQPESVEAAPILSASANQKSNVAASLETNPAEEVQAEVTDAVAEDAVADEVIAAIPLVAEATTPIAKPKATSSPASGRSKAAAKGAIAETALVESAVATATEGALDEVKYWYVLKVQSNREKSIRENLLRRIKREGLESFFGEIVIPTESVVENRSGKKKTVERKLYPGYIMIQMILNDETWFLVRETSGVGDFTGAAGKPIPMQDHEIQKMLVKPLTEGEKGEKLPQKIKIDFAPGETVKIKEGVFENFEGTVASIDENTGKISVLIEILGRSTPVELGSWEVEAV